MKIQAGQFRDVSPSSGPSFAAKRMGRGVAVGDYDNDGDVDVLVLNLSDQPTLLRNELETDHHWLRVRLVGSGGNRDAIGAIVKIRYAGREQMRHVRSGGTYASHSDLRLHFGLGEATKVDSLEVQWPMGKTTALHDVAVDRPVTVHELPAESRP